MERKDERGYFVKSLTYADRGSEVIVRVEVKGAGGKEVFCLPLLSDSVIELSIEKGQLNDEDFEALAERSDRDGAIRDAMKIIAYGDNTRKNLSLKLMRRGHTRASVDEAIEYIADHGYLNEEGIAQKMCEACLSKHWGKRKITAYLYKQGISYDKYPSVADYLDSIDFVSVGVVFIKNKCRTFKQYTKNGIPDNLFSATSSMHPNEDKASNDLRKLINSMLSNGYSISEVKQAMEAAQNENRKQ